jgi:hypothetical protein
MELVYLSRVASTQYLADFRSGGTLFARGGLMAAAMDDALRATGTGARFRDVARALPAFVAERGRGIVPEDLGGIYAAAVGTEAAAKLIGIQEQWMRAVNDEAVCGSAQAQRGTRVRREEL